MAVSKIEQIEQEKGKPLEELLQELYPIHGSQTALAKALGVTQGTMSLWFVRFGLKEKRMLVKEEKAS